MTLRIKNIIGFLLLILFSAVTGLAVGKIYVDSLETVAEIHATEEELREKKQDIETWVSQADAGASPTSFNAVQLYNIAEHKLYAAPKYYKLMTGVVNAPMGIKQQMKSEKWHDGNLMVFNKLSPSTNSLSPAICSRLIYNYDTQVTLINANGSFAPGEEIKGIFDDNFISYSVEQYKEIFNSEPETIMPYIISSITCGQKKYSAISKNADDTYSFKIAIDGNFLSFAGLYYAYEIRYSSGMADLPKWVSLSMEVTIDSNFNFVRIVYDETYKMNVSGIGMMQVNDQFVDTYNFVDVPAYEEVV